MTVAAPLVGVCAAALVLAALAGLARAGGRVAAALCFATAGLFCGVAAIALGAPRAGGALIAVTVLLAAMAFAAGALAGEMAPPRTPSPRVALAVAALAALILVAAWGYAPAWRPPVAIAPTAAFALPRGGDLFIALATLVGIAGAAAALLGFGERGVLGADRRGPE